MTLTNPTVEFANIRMETAMRKLFGRNKKKQSKSDTLTALLFLLPSLAGFALFYGAPFAVSFVMSLFSSPVNGHFVWLQNYVSLLSNKAFAQAAFNTAIFTGIGVPLLVALSLLLAMALRKPVFGNKALRTIFISPLVIPVASVVLVFQVLFSDNGALNGLLASMDASTVDWLKTGIARYVVMLLYLWKNIGYNMVLFLAGLGTVSKPCLEAAEMDGANGFQKFRHIIWPTLLPTTFFVVVMSIINSFKVFREVYLLAGSYPQSSIYTLQHFMNNMFTSLDYQKLTSAAFVMAVGVTLIAGLFVWIRKRSAKRKTL
jgi:multiple sugar transport system permease protein